MSNTQNDKHSKGQRLTKKVRSMFSKGRASLPADTQAESTSPSLPLSMPDSMAPDHDLNTMIKDGLKSVLHGVELLLKKAEKSTAGTPFQAPISGLNSLIELKNAVLQNNDELNIQIAMITERLEVIKDANNQNPNSADLTNEFAGKLQDKLKELDEMSKKSLLNKVINSEEVKSQINYIFKDIDNAWNIFE
ncbi:hypothetical protein C0992_005281, partial [Termitomyces sp. T32_za158]